MHMYALGVEIQGPRRLHIRIIIYEFIFHFKYRHVFSPAPASSRARRLLRASALSGFGFYCCLVIQKPLPPTRALWFFSHEMINRA